MTTAIGYVRVSTSEQADSGLGLEAQRAAILDEAARRGWTVVEMIEDAGESGSNLDRPGITAALEVLRHRQADTLVVAKLDRLSRSLLDFAGLMQRAQKERWALVALDLGIDMTTPAGEMNANIVASVAQFERRRIGERVREAMAAKKARGEPIGRPRVMTTEVVERIRYERGIGWSMATIAAGLNADAVTTAHGGRQWWPSTIRRALSGGTVGE